MSLLIVSPKIKGMSFGTIILGLTTVIPMSLRWSYVVIVGLCCYYYSSPSGEMEHDGQKF